MLNRDWNPRCSKCLCQCLIHCTCIMLDVEHYLRHITCTQFLWRWLCSHHEVIRCHHREIYLLMAKFWVQVETFWTLANTVLSSLVLKRFCVRSHFWPFLSKEKIMIKVCQYHENLKTGVKPTFWKSCIWEVDLPHTI
jgi:hypothetical protein